MMRAVLVFALLTAAAQAALVAPAKSAPLVAPKVQGHVTLSVEQQKTMHSGCVSACRPSPVESKCVTACETAMYKCIDETGPNETPADTKTCQDAALKKYEETKGIELKEEKKEEKKEGAKKEEKKDDKKEKKKAKMFLQVASRDDDEEDSDDSTDTEGEDMSIDDQQEAAITEMDDENESQDAGSDSDVAEDDADQLDEEAASEDESATSDDEEASEDEEEGSDGAEEAEETSEEASSADDADQEESEGTEGSADEEEESQSDEGAGEDEESESEESFVQTGETTVAGDAAVGDVATDDDTEAANAADDVAGDDAAAAATNEESTDEGETSTDEEVSEGEDKDASSETEEQTEQAPEETTDAKSFVETPEAAVDDASPGPAVGDLAEATAQSQAAVPDEAEVFVETGSSWKPEVDSHIKLYEHPQGSTFVTPCPVTSLGTPEACTAYFGGKADTDKCPQITCPKALGVTMKLTCGGGCCPTCWAPDHVIAVDRHTSIDDAAVVDSAPQAPSTCGGVKCFKLNCASGFSEGHVNGSCCYSCIQGR